MDIRKYLTSKPAQKRKIIDDDDDDVIPPSPDVGMKAKKSETQSNHKKTKPSLKEIKTTDLFGKEAIKRTEPIVKKTNKKTETGIHSDEEFDKSLLELDNFDNVEQNNDTHHKETVINGINKDKDKKHSNKAENSSKEKQRDKVHSKATKDEHSKDTKSSNKEMKEHKERSKDKNDKPSKDSKSSSKEKNDCESKKKTPSPSKSKSTNKTIDNIKKEIRDTNKRKFEEFIDDDFKGDSNKKSKIETVDVDINKPAKIEKDRTLNDSQMDVDHDLNKSSTKKKRMNKSLNESALTDEERHERKIHSAALYQKYLNRSGPKHLGTKEIPEGAPECLKNCAFLLTGVLDSFEREEVVDAIKKYGGEIKSGISKKVTHVLAGDDAGPAKTAKAQELGIPIIYEDDFLKMIKDSTKTKADDKRNKEKKSKDIEQKDKKVNGFKEIKKEKADHKIKDEKDKSHHKLEVKKNHDKISPKKEKHDQSSPSKDYDKEKSKIDHDKRITQKDSTLEIKDGREIKIKKDVVKLEENTKTDCASTSTSVNSDVNVCGEMWVEKYKPQNLKQIIGQHGEASNVNKLVSWLKKWYVNRQLKLPKPSPWAKNDDGGYFKAALLSGPPGVGKTTTVSLVCKELGFDMVEFNASDTRNKTLIREQIGELLTTNSLSAFASGVLGKQAVSKKHVLVMDEVDGMAGNEDRGGLQELIGLIKSTSVPIICMCNDRNSPKMRSLVNYCYDLKFSRPKVEQIKAAMRSVCCKENLKIPPDVLGQLIVAANQDVRQTLNLLSMWAIDPSRLDPDKLSRDAASGKKDVKLGPWEAIRKVFSAEEHKTMTINDKSDLFFYDYSLAPLFVQENYLQVQPHCPKHEVLERISAAADSIAYGDVFEARIRGSQAWGLLPMQAMFSSVIPGSVLSGHVAGQIQFPAWLGKNSRANKMHRLAQEIHAHTRLSTTGSKSSIYLDYAPHLRDAILTPLIKEKADGIGRSLEVLESYNLLRDDLDSLTELSLWPGQRNPNMLVDSKVKAAMTRTYNKKATALPYAPAAVKKGRPKEDDELTEECEDEDRDEQDSDPENDALIKKKKTKEPPKTSSADKLDKPSTSKGKSNSGKGKKK